MRTEDTKDAEIAWLKSALVTLLTLANTKNPRLTHEEVATICRRTLDRYSPPTLAVPSPVGKGEA